MADKYTQCTMRKGLRIQTAWIPEKFAKVDLVLEIKDKEPGITLGTEDGWVVHHVGATLMEDDIPVHRDGRNQLRSLDKPRKRTKNLVS